MVIGPLLFRCPSVGPKDADCYSGLGKGIWGVMAKPNLKAEQDGLRVRIRGVGMNHDEIAVEFARRYRLRPRAAYRLAHGWTQQQAADHINAHTVRSSLPPEEIATQTPHQSAVSLDQSRHS